MTFRLMERLGARSGWLFALFFVSALWLSGTVASQALDVQPLRVTLEIGKGQTAGTIAVNNTGTEPMPFEVTVERRIIDENGQQRFEPVEDDFIVFPPQGLVAPGGTQAVRFQYLGEIDLTETQGYVLRVSEVPVRDPNFSGIQFAYSFGAAIYIKPNDATDRIQVESFEREENTVRAVLKNAGNDYSLLTAKQLRVTVGGETLRFSRDELTALIPNPLVSPGATRYLEINFEDLPEGSIESIRFD
ncbi:fimbria/pilus periplasmic chaperone [Qipengyuania sp. JC766]|uniref:fimbrial biogenesis chaperone n=1 Tax=Qipengyuania sp. JC766 TaxID=3232139 RepID=UPI00345B216B